MTRASTAWETPCGRSTRAIWSKGLLFDGRIKEDFKLSTGTWVSVGPLRARIVQHFAPFVRDAVITGHDRDEIGMLAVPDVDACRTLCPDLAADTPAQAVLAHDAVRARIRQLLAHVRDGGNGQRNTDRESDPARGAPLARCRRD